MSEIRHLTRIDLVDPELLEKRSFPDRSQITRIHKSPWSPFPWSVQQNPSSNKSYLYFMTLHAKIFLAF